MREIDRISAAGAVFPLTGVVSGDKIAALYQGQLRFWHMTNSNTEFHKFFLGLLGI